MDIKPKILFVCGKNQWRSPTAENIYRNDNRILVRSAGVSPKSKHKISLKDIEWADLILVMEKKHQLRILEEFRGSEIPPIDCLEIPDEYEYMDSDLIECIRMGTESIIRNRFGIE